jgi:hypothetical protein
MVIRQRVFGPWRRNLYANPAFIDRGVCYRAPADLSDRIVTIVLRPGHPHLPEELPRSRSGGLNRSLVEPSRSESEY